MKTSSSVLMVALISLWSQHSEACGDIQGDVVRLRGESSSVAFRFQDMFTWQSGLCNLVPAQPLVLETDNYKITLPADGEAFLSTRPQGTLAYLSFPKEKSENHFKYKGQSYTMILDEYAQPVVDKPQLSFYPNLNLHSLQGLKECVPVTTQNGFKFSGRGFTYFHDDGTISHMGNVPEYDDGLPHCQNDFVVKGKTFKDVIWITLDRNGYLTGFLHPKVTGGLLDHEQCYLFYPSNNYSDYKLSCHDSINIWPVAKDQKP